MGERGFGVVRGRSTEHELDGPTEGDGVLASVQLDFLDDGRDGVVRGLGEARARVLLGLVVGGRDVGTGVRARRSAEIIWLATRHLMR